MTEIRAYAERVLYGDRLQDKLFDPGQLTDVRPGAALAAPALPGRPDALPIATGRPASDPLPGPDALTDPAVRARLLRRFAHHELQALELMAVVLLRFPDADPDFRRSLAATLRDEQRHLGLYLDRMESLGMPEPEPGSRFFWDLLARSPSPEGFIAGMSLTLEQANLDFLSAWGKALSAVGDSASVRVLDEVYRDEIRHVRHGVTWMGRLCPDQSLWDAWQAHLAPPLTPRRARGPLFDRPGRERAGLPDEVIARVRTAGSSKGRTPRLYTFEPWFEASLHQPGYTPSQRLQSLAADLTPTLAVLCGEDDVLLCPRPPSARFLAGLAERGWPLPEHREGASIAAVTGRFDTLRTWGSTAADRARSAHLSLRRAPTWHEDTARLASKDGVAEILSRIPDDPRLDLVGGITCSTVDEVRAAEEHFGDSVIKLPLATAGRGVFRAPVHLPKLLRTHGSVVVEPWRERVLDLSLQAVVTDQGLRDIELVRFITTPDGRFRGVACGAWRRGLSTELQRFLSGDGREPRFVQDRLRQALEVALRAAPGHRGPIGLDALIARVDGALKLRPVVELNPRLTFGRVGAEIGRRLLARGAVGFWAHLTRRDLGPHSSFVERSAALPPPVGRPLRSGALATTDPHTAEQVWTVLIAAETVDDAVQVVSRR